MSAWGPATVYFCASSIRLRICTPLLPTPFFRRTLKVSSKSLYFFLVQRKVLCLGSSGVEPMMAPSLTLQYFINPSQPSRFLPLKISPEGLSSAKAALVLAADNDALNILWLRLPRDRRYATRSRISSSRNVSRRFSGIIDTFDFSIDSTFF